MINLKYPLILASKSPRRQQLLREAGFEFTIQSSPIEEVFPESMEVENVPTFLAKRKALGLIHVSYNNIIISADTIVVHNNKIFGKPESPQEAQDMLRLLSGTVHKVFTGVCIAHQNKCTTFHEVTDVYFKELRLTEIDYYVKHYAPMDKAGAYGIQEWIGLIGITKICGSYLNVVGLPVAQVYNRLDELNLLVH